VTARGGRIESAPAFGWFVGIAADDHPIGSPIRVKFGCPAADSCESERMAHTVKAALMTDDDSTGTVPADLETSAAWLRFDWEDVDALLHALVERLSSVPGLKIVVNYRNGRLRRLIGDIPYVNDLHRSSDPIRRMAVTVGVSEYWVESKDGALACGVDTLSLQKGPATEPLPFSGWADLLLREIVSQNHMSHESAVALRKGERA